MLSKREQKALRELESQLTVDDPTLARSFVTPTRRTGRRIRKAILAIAIAVVALVAAFILLVTNSSATVFGLAVIAALVWVSWRAMRNSDASPPSG